MDGFNSFSIENQNYVNKVKKKTLCKKIKKNDHELYFDPKTGLL